METPPNNAGPKAEPPVRPRPHDAVATTRCLFSSSTSQHLFRVVELFPIALPNPVFHQLHRLYAFVMAPKRRAVDQLPRTPRPNARRVIPDPALSDSGTPDAGEATYELNEGLGRVRNGPVSYKSRLNNEA
jgi:hypothetical protein